MGEPIMITARSCIVHMPPGHYDKIAQVIRHMVSHRSGYKWHTGKYRRPPKRTRPGERWHIEPSFKRQREMWVEGRELIDSDELLELWIR